MSVENDQSIADALQDLLVEDHDFSEMLDGIARASAEYVSQNRTVLCGITLRRPKRNAVVASSSEEARQLDEVQAGFDEGPCLEAQYTNTVIRVPDVRHENRWPDYMRAVRDSGLRSVLAVPLGLNGEAMAAMNFYTRDAASFQEDEISAIQLYSAVASKAVLIAVRMTEKAELAENLQAALESRTSIDVAVGILMAQSRCSQDEAFTTLQKASSHRNVKLRVLAEELVASIGSSVPTTAFEP